MKKSGCRILATSMPHPRDVFVMDEKIWVPLLRLFSGERWDSTNLKYVGSWF
jgi:hypothetical protein